MSEHRRPSPTAGAWWLIGLAVLGIAASLLMRRAGGTVGSFGSTALVGASIAGGVGVLLVLLNLRRPRA